MRLTFAAAVAMALTALVAGCGGGNGGASGPETVTVTTATTATVTVSTATTATVTVSTDTTDTGPTRTTTIPWPPTGFKRDQNIPVLRTPSGNIECALYSGGLVLVVCAAGEHEWTLPPKPASCEFFWGDAVFLEPTGRPQFRCANDPPFERESYYWPRVAFPYGASVSSGKIRCTSRTSGVTCTNRDKHGFFLSRQRVTFF